ncbi:30S ribosomal protein S11 [Patescibacteria group bacterium]
MATKTTKKAKKKTKIQITHGQVHVQATYNNTIVMVADLQGNALAWSSAGGIGFKGAKKATPYAAGKVVEDVLTKLEGSGLSEVDIYVKGIGSGRESAVRAFQANGINVAKLKDVTPVPHNGVRQRRPRRV